MDRFLLDTSIMMAAAGEAVIGEALRVFLRALGKGYIILYTVFSLEELRMTTTRVEYMGIVKTISSIAALSTIDPDKLRDSIGRYGKTVKKIGPHDVLIALNAVRENAVLVTGDWEQAMFYMNISGKKPVFIPLKQLKII